MLAITVSLSSCNANSFPEDFDEALENVDVRKCLLEGGSVTTVGLFQTPACVKSYVDAGKRCEDSQDCAGRCVAEEQMVEKGTRLHGVCESNDSPFGCSSEIRFGKSSGSICLD